MDRRKVEHVESHRADVGQACDDIIEGAVAGGVAGLRAREQLIPACEFGLRTFDVEHDRAMLGGKRALLRRGDRGAGLRRGERGDACGWIVARKDTQRVPERRRVARNGVRPHGFEILPRFDQFERDVCAGFGFQLDVAAERAEVVAPRLDGKQVPPDARRREGPAPAIVAEDVQRGALPILLVGCAPQQFHAEQIMAVGEDVCFHCRGLADDALHRERPALDPRLDAVDDDARRLGGLGQRAPVARRSCDDRLRALDGENANFVRSERCADIGAVERLRMAKGRTSLGTERIERQRQGMRSVVGIDQHHDAAARSAHVPCVCLEQSRDRTGRSRGLAHLACKIQRRKRVDQRIRGLDVAGQIKLSLCLGDGKILRARVAGIEHMWRRELEAHRHQDAVTGSGGRAQDAAMIIGR